MDHGSSGDPHRLIVPLDDKKTHSFLGLYDPPDAAALPASPVLGEILQWIAGKV